MNDKMALNMAGLAFAFFVLNAFYTQLFGSPTPFCIARWAVMPLFETWYTLMMPVLTAALLYVLFAAYGWRSVATVIALMVAVAAGPDWINTIGMWGKTCGY
jgi:hypothetical protein